VAYSSDTKNIRTILEGKDRRHGKSLKFLFKVESDYWAETRGGPCRSTGVSFMLRCDILLIKSTCRLPYQGYLNVIRIQDSLLSTSKHYV
jgi:hypothetical protein